MVVFLLIHYTILWRSVQCELFGWFARARARDYNHFSSMKIMSFGWRREAWRGFWRQRSLVVPLVVTIIALVGCWLVAAAAPVLRTGEGWAARYSIYVGTNWLTGRWAAGLAPLIATLIAALNTALAFALGRHTITGRQLWLWSAALVSLGFLWLTLLLVWFNA